MFKKTTMVIGIIGMIAFAGAQANGISANPNTEYAVKAKMVLINAGYVPLQITNQLQGYCTLAHGDFDWNAASFVAKKNGKIEKGAVCGESVYLR